MLLNGFNVEEITEIPEDSDISAVVALVFNKRGQLLVVRNLRGWDMPGGHLENGEAPVEALRREVLEEACATIKTPRLFMLASAGKTMLFYTAEVDALLGFNPKHETTERTFMSSSELITRYGGGMPEMADFIITAAQKQFQPHQ